MIPPIWMIVRVGVFWIPLPVILLWPFFALGWLLLGLVLTGILLGTGGQPMAIGKIWSTSWELLCAFRGTHVDVDTADARVRVSIL